MSMVNLALPPLTGPWTFLGDVHGQLDDLPKLWHPIVQVGDLGIGFVSSHDDEKHVASRNDFWFIRGNHDNPDLCRAHSRYLGDWGSHESMFWVSGAWSIDQAYRIEGRDWWHEEELSAADGERAFADYVAAKPRVMVSHDGPISIFERGASMALRYLHRSSTGVLLQAMLEAHQPEVWLFGHHHLSKDFVLGATRFRCLAEHETLTLTFAADGRIEWPA